MPTTLPAQPVYKTGKAGRLTIGASYVFISNWDMSLDKTWADATDSSGFDTATSQLWRKQAAGSIGGSGTIKGFFDFNGSSAALMTALLGDVAVAAVLDYDHTQTFASGLINIENLKTGVVVEGGETIGFECSFKTYGIMTLVPTPA